MSKQRSNGSCQDQAANPSTSHVQNEQLEGIDVDFIPIKSGQVEKPCRRPDNFSWIIDGVLAGSAIPYEIEHFQFYVDNNISTLVTLTDFKPQMEYAPDALHHIYMPVIEFEAPSIDQIKDVCDIVEKERGKGKAVCVHCHWGRGRTGVMLAAYLLFSKQVASPHRAINIVRQKRPFSIETYEQEEVVYQFFNFLQIQNEQSLASGSVKAKILGAE